MSTLQQRQTEKSPRQFEVDYIHQEIGYQSDKARWMGAEGRGREAGHLRSIG